MIDFDKVQNYVEVYGSSIEKIRLKSIITEQKPNLNQIIDLINLQNDDGGFPYKNIKGKLSTINNSLFMLSWFDDLNLINEDISLKIFDYLIKKETTKGIWQESQEILEYNPPNFMNPTNYETTIYDTVYSLFWLLRMRITTKEKYEFYNQILNSFLDEDGIFFGYIHNTWLGFSCLGMMNGWESKLLRKINEFVESKNIQNAPCSSLSWMLLSLLQGGLDPTSDIVIKLKLILFGKQENDGSFKSEDGGPFKVETTIQVLKIAKMLKLLNK